MQNITDFVVGDIYIATHDHAVRVMAVKGQRVQVQDLRWRQDDDPQWLTKTQWRTLEQCPDSYKAIYLASERFSQPSKYRNDLIVHDLNYLLRPDASTEFGYVLREMGTHIVDPRGEDATTFIRAIGQSFSDYPHFFWYDGEKLREIYTAERLIDHVRQYQHSHETSSAIRQ